MNPSTTDGKLVKYFKDDDSWSVQTTDEGLEMELESLFGTSRQTSDWSAMSEDASNDQVVLESEFNPDCRTTSDDGSEADIKEEIPKVSAESLRKTKMCKYFTQGSCKRGLKCNFAHDTIYLKVRPNFFRTSLCLAFARSGFCKNGDNCKYAHGNNQLQNMPPKGNTSMASLTASGPPVVDENFIKVDRSINLTPEASDVVAITKNTFLHVCPQTYARRRAVSCHQ
jgi:hypothetical protein